MPSDFSEFDMKTRGRAVKPPATGKRGSKATEKAESTANWPGLPGGKQSRPRNNGVPRGKFQLKPEGL